MRAAVLLILLSVIYAVAGTADAWAGQLLAGPFVVAVLAIAFISRPRSEHRDRPTP